MIDDAESERQVARQRRLHDTIDRARISAGKLDRERLLFALGAILVPLGLLLIGVAWKGTANTGAVFEQVPFLVSGGLGGLALVVLGGFLYFAWWQTRALREAREQSRQQLEVAEATLEQLRELTAVQHELIDRLAAERTNGRTPPTRRRSPAPK
jgi:hypothetical protein